MQFLRAHLVRWFTALHRLRPDTLDTVHLPCHLTAATARDAEQQVAEGISCRTATVASGGSSLCAGFVKLLVQVADGRLTLCGR